MTNQYRRHTSARSRGFNRIQQMTFSELVSALELCLPDAQVKFTFGFYPIIKPDHPFLCYYNAFHDNAAISYTRYGQPPTVQQVLDALRPLVNRPIQSEFGDLIIDPHMPLWAGHETNDTAIVGVTEDAEYNIVYLQTWAITGD